MYRTIYPYSNKDAGFLQFHIGDVFNLIEQIDGFWWSVVDEGGCHGLVPATYLEVNSATEEDVLRSLDKSIESISKSQNNGKGALNAEQRRILQKLISHRQMVSSGNSLWCKGSSLLTNGSSTSLTNGDASNGVPQQPKRQAPKAPAVMNLKKGKSIKRTSAPAPPGGGPAFVRSQSVATQPSQNISQRINDSNRTKSLGNRAVYTSASFDEGATSKIYNIVVNHGDTQLPTSPPSNPVYQNGAIGKTTPLQENHQVSVERDHLVNGSAKDSTDSAHSKSNGASKITELRGKNLVISKSKEDSTIVGGLKATNFKISKSSNETDTSSVEKIKSKTDIINEKSEKEKAKSPEKQELKKIEKVKSVENIEHKKTDKAVSPVNGEIKQTNSKKSPDRSEPVNSGKLVTAKSSDNLNKNKTSSGKTKRAPEAPVSPVVPVVPVVQTASKQSIQRQSSVQTVTTQHSNASTGSSFSSTSLSSFKSTSIEASSTPNTTMSSERLSSSLGREVQISEKLGKDLIDSVRSRCKLSFNKSLAAVRTVLLTLGEDVPDIKEVTDRIRNQIVDEKLSAHRGALAHEDATRLQEILDKLSEHKDDSQQRNWAVHEDFEVIKELLDDLIITLGEIDPSISRTVLREDEYRYINDLIIFYQMEHRSKLRVALLHVFGCFCELGADFITTLLCSVLPTELALDMMQDQKDILKFLSSALALTMVFSTGESVPYNHYVQFNENFINFLLDTIENPPDADVEDQVPDALVGVLLAFNQHFRSPKTNLVLPCIAKRTMFRTFSEKILLLVNRERDPVALFEFVKSVPDSVMKLLIDLFASSKTSGIFFTNDLMVLIDIILRQIMDRPVKDKVRTEYLSLFHSLLNTTNYSEHRHRAADFKRCFDDILMNRELESEVDLYIVSEITKRFSDLF